MSGIKQTFDFGSESSEEAVDSTEAFEARLNAVRAELATNTDTLSAVKQGKLHLDEGELLNALERHQEAWQVTRPAFDTFIHHKEWDLAAETCDVLSQTHLDGSLAALANGIWVAVSFPVDPQVTLSLLQYVIDETPDNSDGAAVAAAAAKYVVDLRANDAQYNDLSFFATQMMGAVARRHSDIEGQDAFDAWIKRLELDQPEKFLIRLRNAIDVMAQDDWWLDHAAIQQELPKT